MRRIRKSVLNRMMFGVCGGVGEYFNIDPLIVRILWFCISLFYGFGIILYLICALVIPSYNTYDSEE